MARPKRGGEAARTGRAIRASIADAKREERERAAPVDGGSLLQPSPSRDLVPVFMMIETDLFQRLNDKAAARRTGYDLLLRTILRDHIGKYPEEQPPRRTGSPPARRKKGTR